MKPYLVPLCLLIMACFACAHEKEPTPSENTYHNPEIGLVLEKPEGWVFVSAQQSQRNRENAELQDKQLEREVRNEANLPTVSLAKYPEPHPTVNPTVQIKHLVKPSPDLGPQSILGAAVSQMQNGVIDFEVIAPLQVTEVSGHQAARMEAGFMMKTVPGDTFAVHSRMWAVERGEDLFIIGMSGPTEGEDVSEEEFAAILASIKIKK